MHFDDFNAVRRPKLERCDGIDVLQFHSVWQIKLMLERWFVSFISNYVQTSDDFRLVLRLGSMDGITRADLGNVAAVFLPLIEYGGIVCLCELNSAIDPDTRKDLRDSGFLIASELSTAIQAIKDAELEV